MKISPDLLRRIKRIDIRTRRRVQTALTGAYQSTFRGYGLLFDGVRPYIPGDDIRTLDWKVTARTGEPYIKQFIEERERVVMMIMDASASVFFGTIDQQKRERGAELAAILAYAANSNRDRVGLMLFSNQIEHYLAPGRSRNHILRLIRDLLTFQPKGQGTDLALALRAARRTLKRGSVIFIISDFLLPPDQYEHELRALARQHDVITIIISDPLEAEFPEVGLIHLRDLETGQTQLVDTSSAKWRTEFQAQRQNLQAQRDRIIGKAGIASLELKPDDDYISALVAFFQREAGRR